MFGIKFSTALSKLKHLNGTPSPTGVPARLRRIALLRSGRRHGDITRLITPWDIGELTQPFVFLSHSELAPGTKTVVGVPPGIGTLTLVLSGVLVFEGAPGNRGMIVAGGFVWTAPGEVAWHAGGRATDEPLRTLQLWIELPRKPASSIAESQAVAPHEVEEERSARVVLGKIGRARSHIGDAPSDLNYFHVRLRDGQRWRYAAPDGHNVTWLAVDRGGLRFEEDGRVLRKQVALFERSRGVIHVQADGESSFVLGSARQDSDAVGRPVIDEAVEAFVFGEMKRAAEPPVAARSGRRCGLVR
jgi:redox-sensitive bicupin YhaK (pirin superfamily)